MLRKNALTNAAAEKLFCAGKDHVGKRFVAVAVSLLMAGSMFLVSCDSTANDTGEVGKIVAGTMVTEDFLPMWVAEQEGLFTEAGLEVELVTFQSAQEMTTALAAGELDMAMTDPMVAAKLKSAGTDLSLEWVTLGETAAQGRFGIMTSADSGIKTLEDLAGKPIGVGSNTILEYVMDKLMADAGIPTDQIIKEEIAKIPVRYEMMTSNQVSAAALPASLLNLGEKTGMVLVADDTKGQNLSQSVMVVSAELMSTSAGQKAVEDIKGCWDKAATRINDSLSTAPETYRSLLVEKASLPDPIASDYPISTYPLAKRPTAAMVEPVLEWMLEKGYLESEMSYDADTGKFTE